MRQNGGSNLKVLLVSFAALFVLASVSAYCLLIRPPSGQFSADFLKSYSPDALFVLQDGNAYIKGPDGLNPFGTYTNGPDGWVVLETGSATHWLMERNLGGFYLVNETNKMIQHKLVRSWLPGN